MDPTCRQDASSGFCTLLGFFFFEFVHLISKPNRVRSDCLVFSQTVCVSEGRQAREVYRRRGRAGGSESVPAATEEERRRWGKTGELRIPRQTRPSAQTQTHKQSCSQKHG